MREDVLIEVVLKRCEALKRANFWPGALTMRPEAWLGNFEDQDKKIAALLLDRFVFCNDETTNSLLKCAWVSLTDGRQKSGNGINYEKLLSALDDVVFTPVEGETPNPTDSGYIFCRKARQVLGANEERIMETERALAHARQGGTVVFVDDFVGSGDQFLSTWERKYHNSSFKDLASEIPFVAIYLTLVTTQTGMDNIFERAPDVVLSPAHILSRKSTIYGLIDENLFGENELNQFLEKYSKKLRPLDSYIAQVPGYLTHGYKKLGLFLGFAHSIPDATLPIFWSQGIDDWEPLIERS